MNLTHDGLCLWYGTPDAPAPLEDEVVPRDAASVIVGVKPANPTNSVEVRYRTDGGPVKTIPAREVRTDYGRQVQYFAATFPPFTNGDVVEFSPVLSCTGRQCPAAQLADRFRSKFRLEQRQAVRARPTPSPVPTTAASSARMSASPRQPHFGAKMDFVATVALQFEPLQFIGETPWGMRVNLIVRSAAVVGDTFSGKMLESSVDNMLVRRDGMGCIRMRAAIATDDGAILDVEAGGYVDFGPEGYGRAVAHDLPDQAPIVASPLIWTRHPKYAWLARIQCVGVGQTHLDACRASYDIYAATPRDGAPPP